MRKHLKIRADLSDDRQSVKVTILEQTHRGREFGVEDGTLESDEFRHGGVILSSYISEGIERTSLLWLFVLPRDGKVPCTIHGHLTLAEWTRIKAAVEAYNAYFKD